MSDKDLELLQNHRVLHSRGLDFGFAARCGEGLCPSVFRALDQAAPSLGFSIRVIHIFHLDAAG
jgi:hypothetical protein